jgi:hypothetical protein
VGWPRGVSPETFEIFQTASGSIKFGIFNHRYQDQKSERSCRKFEYPEREKILGSFHFSMIHPRFKPRNLARFVMVTNCGLKTMAEIDKHGNVITATFTRDLVLPIIGVEKHPSPSSELSEQEPTPERTPNLEFARIGELPTQLSTEHGTVDPKITYSLKNILH